MRAVKIISIAMSLALMIVFALATVPVMAAEEVTLVGMLNEDNQLVTANEEVYEINESEMANSLLDNTGAKVSVVCTVEEADGVKVINVISFEVME